MENYTSNSYGDGRMDMQVYSSQNGNGPHMNRSYSTPQQSQMEVPKLKKGKSTHGSSSSSSVWSLSDPELQRKKRVASYKVYAVEGKLKGSFRKSFKWVKDRYTQVVYGWK